MNATHVQEPGILTDENILANCLIVRFRFVAFAIGAGKALAVKKLSACACAVCRSGAALRFQIKKRPRAKSCLALWACVRGN